MYFLNSLISALTNLVNAPARLMSGGMMRLRMLNPLSSFQSIWNVIKRIPQQIAAPFKPLLSRLGIKTGDGKQEKRDARADLQDLFARDGERKSRKSVAQVARISQIHLVAENGQRFIVHIGSGAGRAAAQFQMYIDGLGLQLHFTPSEAPDLRTPVHLTKIVGKAEVRVNDAAPKFPAPIRAGDVVTLNGQPHTIELFFFDRTPVVTRVDASYATNTGPHRENNQDAIAVAQHPKGYLFAVADGVGAGQDGDEISAFASKYLLTAFFKNAPYELPWVNVLATAFQHINAEVRAWVRRSPNPAGTTLTAAVVRNWNAYIAHVGDSRAYLFRQNALMQLTQDHMQQQPYELATVAAVNASEPPPVRDVLTRAIGKLDSIEPQILTVPLSPGDKLLLTSDGLTNTVRLNELVTILNGSTAYAAELMVRRAIELDAKDNISAVVVECLADGYVDDIWDARAGDRIFTRPIRSGALKMRKPGEAITHAGASVSGCMTLILLLFLAAVAYWILTR